MIPVLINNRDLLHTTQEQVKFFRRCLDAFVILVDNASTYPPLLEWYDYLKSLSVTRIDGSTCLDILYPDKLDNVPHRVIRFTSNNGPRACTEVVPLLAKKFDYYFLSESDLDFSDCDPETMLSDLAEGLKRYPRIEGAGVSIRIDDLPDTELARLTKVYEGPNWVQHCTTSEIQTLHPPGQSPHQLRRDYYDPEWWNGATDTAGVLRRAIPPWSGGYKGIRSVKHICRHRPFYFTDIPLEKGIPIPEDFKYYYNHASPAGTAYTSFVLDDTRKK